MRTTSYVRCVLLLLAACQHKTPVTPVGLSPVQEMLLPDDPEELAPAMQGWINDSDERVSAVAETPDVFRREFLLKMAARLAHATHNVALAQAPLAAAFVRDLEGHPSAMVVVFDRKPNEPLNFRAAAKRFFDEATDESQTEPGEAFLGRLARLSGGERFVTVVLGAGPSSPRLLSIRTGFPPQLLALLGRIAVARKLSVPVTQVIPVRAFVEPHLPRVAMFGIAFAVKGLATPQLYLLPSSAAVRGEVVRPEDISSLRRSLAVQNAGAGVFRLSGDDVVFDRDAAVARYAPEWGRASQAEGVTGEEVCSNCRQASHEAMLSGARAPAVFEQPELGCGSCRVEYDDGVFASVAQCDAPTLDAACCDWNNGTYQRDTRCGVRCTCSCNEESRFDMGRVIRGVPTFFQFTMDPGTLLCSDAVLDGCGPTAAAQLMAYYDERGYNRLGRDYRVQGAGMQIRWREMARDFRDAMWTWCGNGQTGATPKSVKTAIEDFLSSRGVAFQSDKRTFWPNNQSEAWTLVRTEIDANRPVILTYDSSLEDGIGFAPQWDQLMNAHHALIVGYRDDGFGPQVYIDWGLGQHRNEWIDFSMGEGHMFLITFHLLDRPTGTVFCPPDSSTTSWEGLRQAFAKPDGTPAIDDDETAPVVWYTMDFDEAVGFPVIESLGGDKCQVLGGTVVEVASYDTSTACLTPFQREMVDASVEDLGLLDGADLTHDWIEPF